MGRATHGLVVLGGLKKQSEQVIFPVFEISFNCAQVILLIASKHLYQHQNQFTQGLHCAENISLMGFRSTFQNYSCVINISPPPLKKVPYHAVGMLEWMVSFF